MTTIPARTSQAEAPGAATSRWTAAVGNQPFHVSAAVYNAGADELQVTVGLGRVDWGGGVVTEFITEQQATLVGPAASTTYHVHLLATGVLEVATSAVASGRSVRLAEVDTAGDKTVAEIRDVRGMIPPPPPEVTVGRVLIETQTLLSDAASVTFASIPQTYRHLEIIARGLHAGTGLGEDFLALRFNSDSGSRYGDSVVDAQGSGASGSSENKMRVAAFSSNYSTWLPSVGSARILVPGYTAARTIHVAQAFGARDHGSGHTGAAVSGGGVWIPSAAAAISSVTLLMAANNIESGSEFYLYGLE